MKAMFCFLSAITLFSSSLTFASECDFKVPESPNVYVQQIMGKTVLEESGKSETIQSIIARTFYTPTSRTENGEVKEEIVIEKIVFTYLENDKCEKPFFNSEGYTPEQLAAALDRLEDNARYQEITNDTILGLAMAGSAGLGYYSHIGKIGLSSSRSATMNMLSRLTAKVFGGSWKWGGVVGIPAAVGVTGIARMFRMPAVVVDLTGRTVTILGAAAAAALPGWGVGKVIISCKDHRLCFGRDDEEVLANVEKLVAKKGVQGSNETYIVDDIKTAAEALSEQLLGVRPADK